MRKVYLPWVSFLEHQSECLDPYDVCQQWIDCYHLEKQAKTGAKRHDVKLWKIVQHNLEKLHRIYIMNYRTISLLKEVETYLICRGFKMLPILFKEYYMPSGVIGCNY